MKVANHQELLRCFKIPLSNKRTQAWKFLLPILRPLSVVGLAVDWLPGDGVQLAPGLPSGLIDPALLFFRGLLIGNEFFHKQSS